MLSVSHLNKCYGEAPVVDDVSLEIKQNALTSIIGTNGAGKSTLVHIMSRLMKPCNGDVYINKQLIESIDNQDLAKQMAVLKQQNNTFLKLRVRDLVEFGRYPYSKGRLTKEDHEIVDKCMKISSCDSYENRFLDQLSGGQRQRAYLAMVLAQDTDIIFLDEPLASLDLKHSQEIMQLLQKLCRDYGKTIVIVIHDLDIALNYSDEVIAMKDGKVIKKGAVEDIAKPEVLKEVYDLDFEVLNYKDKIICVS